MLLIGLVVAGFMIIISLRYLGRDTAIFLDRKAMLMEETKMVNCTKCNTLMKRNPYEQQCPECRAFF